MNTHPSASGEVLRIAAEVTRKHKTTLKHQTAAPRFDANAVVFLIFYGITLGAIAAVLGWPR